MITAVYKPSNEKVINVTRGVIAQILEENHDLEEFETIDDLLNYLWEESEEAFLSLHFE